MSKKQKKKVNKIESADDGLDWVPDFSFEPNKTHNYRQEGYYVVCRSCDLDHAIHIGINQIMVGVDSEGNPIFKKR